MTTDDHRVVHVVLPEERKDVEVALGGDSSNDRMGYAKIADAKAMLRACKAGKPSAFAHGGERFKLHSASPTQLSVDDESLEWHLVYAAGRWQLAGLDDGSP